MRKLLWGFATLSMVLYTAGCTTGTSESAANSGDRLTFRTVLGKQTAMRAAEFTNDSWQNGDVLTIHAHHEGTSDEAYGDPILLEHTDGQWSYGDQMASLGTHVWYYTWFPSNNPNISNEEAGIDVYSFDYTVPTEEDQEDLIAAAVLTNEPVVNLEFRHILSQVNFGIVRTPGVAVEIEAGSISLAGVHDKGTYTLGAVPAWSGVRGDAEYTYSPLPGSNVTDGLSSGISYMGNAGGDTTNDNDNALMFIPQTFGSGSTATLSFRYRLRVQYEGSDEVVIPVDGGYDTATALLGDLSTNSWTEGKRYLYLFDFSNYISSGRITFTVVVNPWEDDEQHNVDASGNSEN